MTEDSMWQEIPAQGRNEGVRRTGMRGERTPTVLMPCLTRHPLRKEIADQVRNEGGSSPE